MGQPGYDDGWPGHPDYLPAKVAYEFPSAQSLDMMRFRTRWQY